MALEIKTFNYPTCGVVLISLVVEAQQSTGGPIKTDTGVWRVLLISGERRPSVRGSHSFSLWLFAVCLLSRPRRAAHWVMASPSAANLLSRTFFCLTAATHTQRMFLHLPSILKHQRSPALSPMQIKPWNANWACRRQRKCILLSGTVAVWWSALWR